MSDRKASERYARKLGLTEVYVHFGTFDFALNCVVGPWKGVADYVGWKFEDPGEADEIRNEYRGEMTPRGMVFRKYGYCPIIWIPRKPRTPREHGTLAHEVLHAVNMLTHWAKIPLTDSSEEVFCHALGHAVTEIMTRLK